MTMMKVVSQLQKEGHKVTYYIRKDGGILIKSIDGKHYSGATGNAAARSMVGANISEARTSQLKYITKERSKRRRTLEGKVAEEYKRVKGLWNKRFKSKDGEAPSVGYLPKSKVAYHVRTGGEEEALRILANKERYTRGMAYPENIQALGEEILRVGRLKKSSSLIDLGDKVIANMYTDIIKEESIYPAYEELYNANNLYKKEELDGIAANIEAILGI